MAPFDPDMEFEQLVLDLNDGYHPGGIGSGPARNALLWAWALAAGKTRVEREVREAIQRHGSKTALLRALHMHADTFYQFQEHVASLRERHALPLSSEELRAAFSALPADAQLDFAKLAAELLRAPALVQRLAAAPDRAATKLLEAALRAADLKHAVEQLRGLLASGVAEERAYQTWCDEHSWVFSGAYQLRDLVRRIDDESIVDLMLPDVVGYRDIVELKRPDADVLNYDRSHKTYYFAADVNKAIGQVHKYMDRLHESARAGLAKHPHIVAYHPRAVIVLGRSDGWPSQKTETLRGLNQRLHGIDVMTYDHLLLRASAILSHFNLAGELGEAPTRTDAHDGSRLV